MLLAMDKQSVRTTSVDGHLHVEISPISKANVCPYLGAEIPNGEQLGLDPQKVYYLLRDPEELAKAALTFNNLPLLKKHVPVTSAAHPKELVVGSTGTDAVFKAPYLLNSLVVWSDDGIVGVESDEQRELSAAYHYIAEMTPGKFGGLHYDGIMRNIVGNHVALVPEGRAGSDVVVGDSKLDAKIMAKGLKSRKALMLSGALSVYLAPKLATDAKLDLSGDLAGINAKNFKAKKARLITALTARITPLLAADADISDIVELVDALEDVTDGEVDEDAIAEAVADPGPAMDPDEDDQTAVDADADVIAKLMAFLKDKLDDDDYAACTEMVGAAANDPDQTAQDGGGKPMKTGMDAKMVKATVSAAEGRVVARMTAAAQAREDVLPLVGKVSLALDSAEAIYKFALDQAKVSTTGVHPSAYRAMVGMLPKVGDAPRPRVAQDSAEASTFAEQYPHAVAPKRI